MPINLLMVQELLKLTAGEYATAIALRVNCGNPSGYVNGIARA